MRRSQPDPEHAEAVARRLAILGAELSALRGDDEPTRLRGQELPAPVTVPVPGRHAHRRAEPSRLGTLRDRLPGIGPAHVAVVAAIAAVAVGLTAWLVIDARAQPAEVAQLRAASQPLVGSSPSPPGEPAPTSPGTTPSQQSADEVTVDVAGKVRRPGIVVLPAGSRVDDALRAAGGARRGVDLTPLNLARVLVDGEQVLVGVTAPSVVLGTLGDPGTPTPAGALVNINTADQALLETLPGVGPVTAGAIISWRTEHGGFSAVEELVEVDGIGEATLAKLAPLVTI